MYPIITKLGGRRFLLSLLGIMLSTIALMHGDIKDEIYRDLMLGFAITYIGGNVTQKVTAIKSNSVN